MKSRVAVLTDAMSPAFYFPLWHRYYAAQFGVENLHVLTLPGLRAIFTRFPLGEVRELDQLYDDDRRLEILTGWITELLQTHDYVIHVDTDEFLIPDPRYHRSLAAYMALLREDYVTARGFDLFHHISEPPLNPNAPILAAQRRHAFALTGMNKSCVTAIPLRWSRGFHYCAAPPRQHRLFLFHLKRADFSESVKWNRYLSGRIESDPYIRGYYAMPATEVEKLLKDFSARPIERGPDALYREAFSAQFAQDVKFNPATGLYEGGFHIEPVTVEIPGDYRGIL